MADTAALQKQLDDLLNARATGARRVKFRDQETEFRSDAELAAAIADLERRLGLRWTHTVRIHTSKGL